METLFPLATSEQRATAYLAAGSRQSANAGDIATYSRQRLATEPDLQWANWVESSLSSQAGQLCVPREVSLPLESRTRIHRYQLGSARLLAFERNINYHMSEDLKQAGGNENLEKPVQLQAKLAKGAHIYDLRARKYLGQSDRIDFTLDPWQPSLFALLPRQLPEAEIIDFLLKR